MTNRVFFPLQSGSSLVGVALFEEGSEGICSDSSELACISASLKNSHQRSSQECLRDWFAPGNDTQQLVDDIVSRIESGGNNLIFVMLSQQPQLPKHQSGYEWQTP